ncbi:hypothetical protein ACROYT_G014922 [Oculina patagonica]
MSVQTTPPVNNGSTLRPLMDVNTNRRAMPMRSLMDTENRPPWQVNRMQYFDDVWQAAISLVIPSYVYTTSSVPVTSAAAISAAEMNVIIKGYLKDTLMKTVMRAEKEEVFFLRQIEPNLFLARLHNFYCIFFVTFPKNAAIDNRNLAKIRKYIDEECQNCVVDSNISIPLPSKANHSVNNALRANTTGSATESNRKRCKEELKPATDCNVSFGYIGEANKKYSITSEVQLAEALSLEKRGMVTLWVDPHVSKTEHSRAQTMGKKRKANPGPSSQNLTDDKEDRSSYEARLSRLRQEHKIPEFKLRCWARMLVNGTHDSEEEPPDLPFFSGRSKKCGGKLPNTSRDREPEQSTNSAESKIRIRSVILKQLKDLKELQDDGVLSQDEFVSQKEKLVTELNEL